MSEEAQAQEKPQIATAEQTSWWLPRDPITESRLVAILAKMVQCVLDHAEELPPVRHTPTGQVANEDSEP